MQEILLIIYLVVAIALIGIILIQQGKGAVMGASFGAGGANTVFGASGAGNVLTKTTTVLAILFFAIALAISYVNSQPQEVVDEVLDVVPAKQENAPAAKVTGDQLEGEEAPLSSGQVEGETPPVKQPAAAEETAPKPKQKKEGDN